MQKYSKESGRVVNHITPDALSLLAAHSWPGNVRELRNIIERAVVLGSSDTIGPDDLLAELRTDDSARLGIRANSKSGKKE